MEEVSVVEYKIEIVSEYIIILAIKYASIKEDPDTLLQKEDAKKWYSMSNAAHVCSKSCLMPPRLC